MPDTSTTDISPAARKSTTARSQATPTPNLAARDFLIIANPTAGMSAGSINRERLIDSAVRHLEYYGLRVDVRLEASSQAVSDCAEWGARHGYRCIVAAGGDGTVNAVVNGMMRLRHSEPDLLDEIALGVLPLGTGNVFASNLGIAKSWRQACKILRGAHTRRIDVGVVHGLGKAAPDPRHFVLMTGIGFDAKVIEETGLRLKFFLRDYAYVLKTLQNVVLHQGSKMTLHLDGKRVHSQIAWLVMIGNAASYAWDIKVTSHARLDDGLLDVCLMPFRNKVVSIQQALQILMGQHVERGIAKYWQVKQVRIESTPPVPVQLDGDEWGYTPVELNVLHNALRVLVPPESH